VRRRLQRPLLGAAALAFGYLAYVYLMLPDVRVLARTNPTTTAFMQLRVEEGREGGVSSPSGTGGRATGKSHRT